MPHLVLFLSFKPCPLGLKNRNKHQVVGLFLLIAVLINESKKNKTGVGRVTQRAGLWNPMKETNRCNTRWHGHTQHMMLATSFALPLGNSQHAPVLLHPRFKVLLGLKSWKIRVVAPVSAPCSEGPRPTWRSMWSHSTPSAGWGPSWRRERRPAEPWMAPVWLVHLTLQKLPS